MMALPNDLESEFYYDEDGWDMWEDEALLTAGTRTFVPTPDELQYRVRMLDFLKMNDFSERAVHHIMNHDHPSFQLVLSWVKKFGMSGARERVEILLND